MPSTLKVAPEGPEINASSSVNEYGAGPAAIPPAAVPLPPAPVKGPTEPMVVVCPKIVFDRLSYAVCVVEAAPVSVAL